MKYTKLIIVFLFIAFFAIMPRVQAQDEPANAIDKYFQKYVDDERFTVVYISSKLFEMLGKLDVEGLHLEDKEAEAIMDIASDLKGLRILVAEQDARALYDEAKGMIDTKEYEILMTVRDKDEDNVDFLIKEDGDEKVKELLLMVGGGDEFVLLSFVGSIDLEKVALSWLKPLKKKKIIMTEGNINR